MTRFGVSVEKVVATIDVPSSHQGSFRPARKNSFVPEPARRANQSPTPRATVPYAARTIQSRPFSCTASPVDVRHGRRDRAASLYHSQPER